jgi:flavorubredoxin
MPSTTPLHLGGDAWLVQVLSEDPAGLSLPHNSLVLRGAEPVLVDTGAGTAGPQWWAQVESLVTPSEVRWVFVSHEDADAAGNLADVLDRCAAATVLTSRPAAQRLESIAPVPAGRCRWIEDGETLAVPGRSLSVVRPPAYDAPTTIGLFDAVSGVYWAADCFGAPLPHLVSEAAEIDRDVWGDGFVAYHRALCPWIRDVDADRWVAAVARIEALSARVIASTHGPAVRGPLIAWALELLSELAADRQPFGAADATAVGPDGSF